MKTAVVYYSLEGNAQYMAEQIAENLGADLIRLETVKAFPAKGPGKYLVGGKSAVTGEKPALKYYEFDAEKYDTIVLACPVWASNIASPLRTFITENRYGIKDKRIASALCFMGGGAEKAQRKMKECIGIDAFAAELVLVDPFKKMKAENDEKIMDFCRKLQAEQ